MTEEQFQKLKVDVVFASLDMRGEEGEGRGEAPEQLGCHEEGKAEQREEGNLQSLKGRQELSVLKLVQLQLPVFPTKVLMYPHLHWVQLPWSVGQRLVQTQQSLDPLPRLPKTTPVLASPPRQPQIMALLPSSLLLANGFLLHHRPWVQSIPQGHSS
jgi:hypothetical protein